MCLARGAVFDSLRCIFFDTSRTWVVESPATASSPEYAPATRGSTCKFHVPGGSFCLIIDEQSVRAGACGSVTAA